MLTTLPPGGHTVVLETGNRGLSRLTGFRRLADGPVGAVAIVVCGLFVVVAVAAPLLAPHAPNAVDATNILAPPSPAHLLGTDDVGRDLLSRIIYGARPSLLGPLLVTLFSALVGTALGVLAAWRRNRWDAVLSRGFDVMLAFPGVVLAVLAAALFGAGFLAPVIALSIAYVPTVARMMRAAALKERSLPYIEALQLQGLSGIAICARHLLPNLAPLLLVQAAIGFGYAMVDLAAVSFIGLGTQPPAAEWGVLVANGKAAILDGHPQQSLYAAAVIVVAVVAVNLVGERMAQYFEIGNHA
ncbi:ABC transporter permease [Nocardia goodfellowii]